MGWHDRTIETYDTSAIELAEYFNGMGARIEDIERGLALADAGANAKVVEMGCGDGRDAVETVRRCDWYEGVDPSTGLLDLARQKLPETSFVAADALSYEYPTECDVVFAFASLLHVNRQDMPRALQKMYASLRVGGIAYLSLKERDTYVEEAKSDAYGERMFYYYNADLIKELAGTAFTTVFKDRQHLGNTDWFTIALQK